MDKIKEEYNYQIAKNQINTEKLHWRKSSIILLLICLKSRLEKSQCV